MSTYQSTQRSDITIIQRYCVAASYYYTSIKFLNMNVKVLNLLIDQLSISVTPTNKTVGEGATAIFTATASGKNKNFTYQWKKRGNENLPSKVSGVNGAVLMIPNSLKSDEGQYYCIVANEWGRSKKSNDVNLTVAGK